MTTVERVAFELRGVVLLWPMSDDLRQRLDRLAAQLEAIVSQSAVEKP